MLLKKFVMFFEKFEEENSELRALVIALKGSSPPLSADVGILHAKLKHLEQLNRRLYTESSRQLSDKELALVAMKEKYESKIRSLKQNEELSVIKRASELLKMGPDGKTSVIIKKIMVKTAKVAKLYEEERKRCDEIRIQQLTFIKECVRLRAGKGM